MADIIQAANWLKEGKRIRRTSVDTKYITTEVDEIRIRNHNGEPYIFVANDFLADDWEIYEEKSPMDIAWGEYYLSERFHSNGAPFHFRNGWDAAKRYYFQPLTESK